jgi:hypothetical protein
VAIVAHHPQATYFGMKSGFIPKAPRSRSPCWRRARTGPASPTPTTRRGWERPRSRRRRLPSRGA